MREPRERIFQGAILTFLGWLDYALSNTNGKEGVEVELQAENLLLKYKQQVPDLL